MASPAHFWSKRGGEQAPDHGPSPSSGLLCSSPGGPVLDLLVLHLLCPGPGKEGLATHKVTRRPRSSSKRLREVKPWPEATQPDPALAPAPPLEQASPLAKSWYRRREGRAEENITNSSTKLRQPKRGVGIAGSRQRGPAAGTPAFLSHQGWGVLPRRGGAGSRRCTRGPEACRRRSPRAPAVCRPRSSRKGAPGAEEGSSPVPPPPPPSTHSVARCPQPGQP